MPLTADKLFRVHISDDHLTATLGLNEDMPLQEAVQAEQIREQIKGMELEMDEQAFELIQQFAQTLNEHVIPEPIVIARGTAPKHDKDGFIEDLLRKVHQPHLQDSPQADSAVVLPKKYDSQSHYERSPIITTDKDQKLLRIVGPVVGEDGRDVFGKPIPRKPGSQAQIQLGSNVRREGEFVLSNIEGRVDYSKGKIWVDDKLEIRSDVDFSTGNIYFQGEVKILKNVLDLFQVKSRSNSVTVQGITEAADIQAAVDFNAMGGIAGKEKGHFRAGRDITAKYITNANVRAGRDVHVRSEIVNCEVVCKGRLTVENGPVVGGTASAAGGIEVKVIGSEANVKTLVEVGVDSVLREKCNQIAPILKTMQKKIRKIRRYTGPLLENIRYLNNEQKKDVQCQDESARKLEEHVAGLIDELYHLHQKTLKEDRPQIIVHETLFYGVTCRFPRVEAMITHIVDGPLKITPQRRSGVLQVVAENLRTNDTIVLPSGETTDPFWEMLDGILKDGLK